MRSATNRDANQLRRYLWIGGLMIAATLLFVATGCGSDEDNATPNPGARPVIGLIYENPLIVAVDDLRKRALLLHNREASSGPALQLVDLESRRVLSTRILIDYYDVYDLAILSATKGCMAGRPHGNRGYAVHFFSLPDLTLGTQVMTADTAGLHGYLAVDSSAQAVYYSHAGGEGKDGLYKISISSESLVDADNDGQAPYSFDNDLVGGLFSQPAGVHFDAVSRNLVVANSGDNFITLLDASLWGTLHRETDYNFPIQGTTHMSTVAGGLSTVRPQATGFGAGVYVLAGQSSGRFFLARFTVQSNGLDLLETPPVSGWSLRNHFLPVDSRSDVVSLFVAQRDGSRIRIGQYRLNNLSAVAASPYATKVIPDSAIGAIAVAPSLNRMIVADAVAPRLELVEIE